MTEEHKELMRLTAKAMGFGVTTKDGELLNTWTESEYPKGSGKHGAIWNYIGNCDTAQLFNPITSLADRAKMCDELEIGTVYYDICQEVTANHAKQNDDEAIEHTEPYGTDKSLACSLACLRVAAEIGRRKEKEND